MIKNDSPKCFQLPKFLDERGNLSVIEEMKDIPFKVKRAYWIYDVPGGEARGGHAYRENQEFIVALSGSFDVILDDGQKKQTFHLNRSYYGLYVPQGIWREMENFSTNSLSYFSLVFGDLENGSEWWRSINYKIYFDCHYHSDFSKYNYFISNSEPFRSKLHKFFSNDNEILCDSLGFGYPIYHKSNAILSDAAVSSWVHLHTVNDFRYVNESKNLIEKIASVCKKMNIKLTVVTTPVWHSYYKKLDEKQLSLMISFAKELQSKYGVRYLDYMCDKRFVANDYTDCNHMSCDGAKKLSTIISEDLLK